MQTATLTRIQPDPMAIRTRWRQLVQQQPVRKPSEVAHEIGVTESELIAAQVGGTVTRLTPDWPRLLSSLERLGYVRAVTGNDYAVIEKAGVFPEFQHFQVHSSFAGEDMDLRISLDFWGAAFAVEESEQGNGPIGRSLQFFGKTGEAMNKVFLTPHSRDDEFAAIRREFASSDQSDRQLVDPSFGHRKTLSRDRINEDALLDDWADLARTRSFAQLLHKHRVSRLDALAIAEGQFTRAVDPCSVRRLLEYVSREELNITAFLGNSGCVQIHRGPLERVHNAECRFCNAPQGWLSVAGPSMELHFSEEGVASAWVVQKPAIEGHLVSLELLDAQGRDVISFFGARPEGRQQDPRWFEVIGQLPSA